MLHVTVFNVLLASACEYALWRNGSTERIVEGSLILAYAATLISCRVHWRRNPRRSRLAFCVAALRLDPVGAHLLTTFDPGTIRVTYALLIAVWSYPMLLVLESGTFRHQRRLRRGGCDFEWSMRRDDDGPLRPGPDG